MEDKIKFPANVILIDVAFLNEVVYGAKNFLEGKLGRKLPKFTSREALTIRQLIPALYNNKIMYKCCWFIIHHRTC